ncbi:MAG TPA: di-heme oxidoredictase family protein [Candidatus Eisenbacteria bacterium]|nr:di-heme oxidoredictase family protein [Candidatus Eisenbacteria bacterium]
MRRIALCAAAAYALVAVAVAVRAEAPLPAWMTEARSGGEATTDVQSRVAFSQHVPGLTTDELSAFAFGNRIFSTSWIEAPASVEMFDGLGPYFSSRSCSGCHLRDGRGRPPEPGQLTRSMITRLASVDDRGAPGPDSVYGTQLSERALRGLTPEGRLAVRWSARVHRYPDGTRASLRAPRFAIVGSGYGPIGRSTRFSARIAPAVIGTGLLELVPDSTLLALADPDDADRDGISGRIHWRSPPSAARRPGRFGWKATQGTVADQITSALAGDIGITTPAHARLELSAAQHAAAARVTGGDPELDGRPFASLLAYCRMLAVPARRDADRAPVTRGAQLFAELGCVRCHAPTLTTGDSDVRALARQTIHPYTDLLLHDMGPDLSDGMPELDAAPAEWRTPPLWGLGLAARVDGYLFLLHDGRARSMEEAILWHGGEAKQSRDAFRSLPASGRNDLLRFLESL